MKTRSNVQVKDEGYAWVALFSAFGCCFLEAACGASQRLFFIEFIEYFKVSKAETAVITALYEGFMGLSGIYLGPVTDKYGLRPVVILGSIVLTCGLFVSSFAPNITFLYLSLGFFPGNAMGTYVMGYFLGAMQYFEKRRSLAVAVQALGGGLSAFTMPLVTERLIQNFGWRGALMLLAGFQLHGIVFGALFRPMEIQNDRTDKEEPARKQRATWVKKYLDAQIFKDPKLVLQYISIGVIIAGEAATSILIPARVVALGESKTKAALLVSVSGVTGTLTNLLVGALGDKIKQYKTLAMALSVFISGCLASISYILLTYEGLIVFVVLRAMVLSVHGVFLMSVLADLSPPNKISNTTGIAMLVYGTVSLVASPMAGGLVDLTRSYAFPFLIFGIIVATGSVFPLVIYILQRKDARNKKAKCTDDEEVDNKNEDNPHKKLQQDL